MKYPSFTIYDNIFSIAWITLFLMVVWVIYIKNKHQKGYSYFLPFFIWKLVLGMSFAAIYVYVYGGGDTTAYYQGAETMKNLAYDNPAAYFHEMLSTPVRDHLPSYFNNTTGRPPIWIYNEPNSWFVCKLGSIFSFFSFSSYVVINLWFTIVSTIITWKFFRLLVEKTNIQTLFLAIAVLFVPTVGFWCSGIMKDTVVMCALQLLFIALFKIFYSRFKLIHILTILLSSYVIFATRSFVLLAVFLPFFIILTFRVNRNASFLVKMSTRVFGILLSTLGILFFINGSDLFGEFSADQIVQTAETIYLDFQNNLGYLGKRYDLGITEFTGTSMLKATPLAIVTAIFRPFIWESESALMLMNGIEGILLIYMSLQLLNRKNRSKIKPNYFTKDLLLICLLFSLIMAFFVGFTSGLFGVLARLKAPILPFFLIFVFQNKLFDETDSKLLSES